MSALLDLVGRGLIAGGLMILAAHGPGPRVLRR